MNSTLSVIVEEDSNERPERAKWFWKTLSLACWLVCAYWGWKWYRRVPPVPVGYAIGLLGAASAAMATFVERLEWLGKIGWILLMFALLFVETRAINQADLDLKKQFQTVLEGLNKTLSAQNANLKITLDSQDTKFNGTINRLQSLANSERVLTAIATQAEQNSELDNLLIQAFRDQTPPPGPIPTVPPTVAAEPFAVSRTPEQTKELRLKALQLAKDIYDWIASVAQDAPKSFNPDPTAELEYEKRLAEFDTKFGPEANQMVREIPVPHMLTACLPLQGSSGVLELRHSCAYNIEKAALNLRQ